MKKIVFLISLFLIFLSCSDENHDGLYSYQVIIESPNEQMFLIEYIDPGFPNDIFEEIIYYNGSNGFWELQDLYTTGDYLEITVISMDAMLPILIDINIIVNGEYVKMITGDGSTPITLFY